MNNLKKIEENYDLWLHKATEDDDLIRELKELSSDKKKLKDAFYRDLEFGTGGLRGVIGAGTNRMNIYTVRKASQGLANYVIRNFSPEERKIAVSYDSRIKSHMFAETATAVFAANGIQVYMYPELMPTPCLSFAVRRLHCAAGIMITASHNPAKYNGYKVYGADGCQITTKVASEVLSEIENTDIFNDVVSMDVHTAFSDGKASYIPGNIYDEFIAEVKKQSVLFGETVNKDLSIVYSPLNGTGLKPVLRALKENGFTHITVVKEQEMPDGKFPTCPYPNPEIKEAMALGMKYAARENADLLLATDPDCDRAGIAVRDGNGNYILLSGNETGVLLLDYICSQRKRHSAMPDSPVFVKTIVTTDLAERVASFYGVKTVNVLTGFKFIGEQIGILEKEHKENSYIFGFEESYGYLSGSYVRDKDAVNAATLICEMFAWYKMKGINLLICLEELYKKYGYYLNTLYSYEFDGADGFEKMQNIMKRFRSDIKDLGGVQVTETLDYLKGIDSLPKSDVLKFKLENNCSVVVRPSGTEPKLKTYFSVSAKDRNMAKEIEQKLLESIREFIKQ